MGKSVIQIAFSILHLFKDNEGRVKLIIDAHKDT